MIVSGGDYGTGGWMDQKIEFKVGIFIIVTTLLIIFTVGYVAYKKDIFAKEYTYTLRSDTGENITQGMPVLFLGFEIGEVSSIKLDEEENAVLVEIKIPEKNREVLRLSSKFLLETPLLGSPRIKVETTKLVGELLTEEDQPKIYSHDNINELIESGQTIAGKAEKLVEALTTVISNVTKVTENLLVFQEDLNRSMKNIEKLTSQYSEKESLAELITGRKESAENMQKFTSNLSDASKQIKETLKKFDSIAEKANGKIYGEEGVFPLIEGILNQLTAILDNFKDVSGDAASATEDLTATRNKIDAAINEIRILVNDLDQLITFGDEPGIELP
jgi:phospholipid/cholesterol/gamma-HCH transport system substrate-binding protein